MSSSSTAALLCLFSGLLLYLYIRMNDAKLMQLPHEVASAFSPKRISAKDALEAAAISKNTILESKTFLPPRTGRRYIVVGGAGFLGGWIVRHLLERGEDPKRIRVLDVRAPTRGDLITGLGRHVDFHLADISDREQVLAAFNSPWPSSIHGNEAEEVRTEITVFHTAANIRFYERDPRLQHLSDKVNVEGTRNVLDAARAAGVTVLIYTSSGSVSIRRTRLWLWPWEKRPEFSVQIIDDDDRRVLPRCHDEMFSNYAVSKFRAERHVRAADRTPLASSSSNSNSNTKSAQVLRTGCLRPGNGIYGTGGDMLCGAYLARQVNPSWVQDILQNFIYVENASLAHMCYEQRLIEQVQGSTNPDVGGQAFGIVDAGPPLTYGDVYTVLTTLTDGRTVFPRLSATAMLMLSQMFEGLYLLQSFTASSSNSFLRRLGRLVPAPTGGLINLQPSLFFLTMVHLIWDDSRARTSPENGGLGYEPQWTTLGALCKLVEEHQKAEGRVEGRSMNGGIGLGFGMGAASRGVEKVMEDFSSDAALLNG
ncbi:NAD-P-binding protein [Russula earlei]|uniref:NAD-P-binding protein n=1 Tax=Russula earlei TaxID=71964 RepID=A0ACC0UJ98_9AGAM|nr:NAD-P-binding protein [Russula earlei]